jgi:hypothetical protein
VRALLRLAGRQERKIGGLLRISSEISLHSLYLLAIEGMIPKKILFLLLLEPVFFGLGLWKRAFFGWVLWENLWEIFWCLKKFPPAPSWIDLSHFNCCQNFFDNNSRQISF